MKDFFYQLSWDKELRRKTLSRFAIGSFAVSIALAICVVGFANFSKPEVEEQTFKSKKADSQFNLNFSESNIDDEQSDNSITEAASNHDGGESGSEGGGTPGGGGGEPQHVHSWYTVVDSEPWDEEI